MMHGQNHFKCFYLFSGPSPYLGGTIGVVYFVKGNIFFNPYLVNTLLLYSLYVSCKAFDVSLPVPGSVS